MADDHLINMALHCLGGPQAPGKTLASLRPHPTREELVLSKPGAGLQLSWDFWWLPGIGWVPA